MTKGYDEHFSKGARLFEQKKYGQALSEYQKAVRCAPERAGARFEICECHLAVGNLKMAKLTLCAMRQLVRGRLYIAFYYGRFAYIAIEEGDYPLAIACLRYAQRIKWRFNTYMELRHAYKKFPKSQCPFTTTEEILKYMDDHEIPIIFVADRYTGKLRL